MQILQNWLLFFWGEGWLNIQGEPMEEISGWEYVQTEKNGWVFWIVLKPGAHNLDLDTSLPHLHNGQDPANKGENASDAG